MYQNSEILISSEPTKGLQFNQRMFLFYFFLLLWLGLDNFCCKKCWFCLSIIWQKVLCDMNRWLRSSLGVSITRLVKQVKLNMYNFVVYQLIISHDKNVNNPSFSDLGIDLRLLKGTIKLTITFHLFLKWTFKQMKPASSKYFILIYNLTASGTYKFFRKALLLSSRSKK